MLTPEDVHTSERSGLKMLADHSEKYVLTASGLTKDFGGFTAVKDVNLAINENSIHALIGPNGAGKSTVFNLLTKFHSPTAGQIAFRGRDITHLRPAEIARLGIVRSFQISSVFPHLSVLDNVRIGLQRPNNLAFQFWLSRNSLSSLNDRADELIESVNLSDARQTLAGKLSYGRKRALEIATTLTLDPDVLLLDEPMAGLGHEDIARISQLIRRVSRGRTIVMVEHNLRVVQDLCDQITVLQHGSVICEGPYSYVSNNPQVREAYLGVTDDMH